jgi:tyrosine-protein phosphatase YwqE
MEKAAIGVTPEIITEEIVAEAKDEVKEAPSRIRKKLRQLAASDVVDSSLAGMYGAKFQALAKEHE